VQRFVPVTALLLLFAAAPVSADFGDVLESFPCAGDATADLAWVDGQLYQVIFAGDDEGIHVINPDNGNVTGTLPAQGSSPQGLAYDGVNLWQVSITDDEIYKLDPATAALRATYPAPRGENGQPLGLAWDGEHLWLGDTRDPEVLLKLDTTSVSILDSLPAPGDSPYGFAYGNGWLWVSDNEMSGNPAVVYMTDPSTGAFVDSFDCPGGGGSPNGLAFDGTYLWLADNNTDMIYKVDVAAGDYPPHQFGLLSPAQGAIIEDPEVDLLWESSADPDTSLPVSYTVLRDTLGNFATATLVADGISDTTATASELPDDSYILWKVAAVDFTGDTTWSSPSGYFITSIPEPPEPFGLLEPQNAAFVASGEEISFSWQEASDPDPEDAVAGYRLEVASDSLFETIVANPDAGTSTTVTAGPFEDGMLWWRVVALDGDGLEGHSAETRWIAYGTDAPEPETGSPLAWSLSPVWPNPFNASATVAMTLPHRGRLQVSLHDVAGREVLALARGTFAAGRHQFQLRGRELASGTYLLRARLAGEEEAVRRVVLVK
jgi:hypothetical protein